VELAKFARERYIRVAAIDIVISAKNMNICIAEAPEKLVCTSSRRK
jgi:hypothetical protein